MATTLKAMRRQELHPAQRGNLASGPAIAAPDREEHVQLVEADQRFQAALEHAIARRGRFAVDQPTITG